MLDNLFKFMKNLTLLKTILLAGVILSAKNTYAQLASDTPAQNINKNLLSSKQEAAKSLVSDTPVLIDSKTNKKDSIPKKVVLPSESVTTRPNELKNARKKP